MGVYIKGMEMPKSCYHCVWMFRDKPNGKVYCTATETNSNIFAADQWLDVSDVLAENRHPNCPLVPVPPHGRLIDADAALRDGWTISRTYSASPTEMVYETKAIDCLQTIIPAEEGE